MESLRILGLFLRKNWLVRKRHWIKTLFGEMLLPISLIFCARLLFDKSKQLPDDSKSIYAPQSLIHEFENYEFKIAYAPKNQFIDELMVLVQGCLHSSAIQGFESVGDRAWTHFVSNKTSVVTFHESTNYSTKQLHYTISTDFPMAEYLYNPYIWSFRSLSKVSRSVLVQTCLEQSFVQIKTNQNISQIFIQRVPEPALDQEIHFSENSRYAFNMFSMIAFMIPLFFETFVATSEKFNEINVLMSMNGVSDILNYFSWITSGLVVLSPLCVMSTVLMFAHRYRDFYSFIDYGNPIVLFVFYIAHVIHVMAFGIHVSAYFTKPVTLSFALISINMVVVIVRIFGFGQGNDIILLCLGIIFPNIILYEGLQSFTLYGEIGVFFQWNNLFESPGSEVQFSFGLALITSVAGTIFHFILTAYIQAISPGLYNVGKGPLFFIKTNSKICVEDFPDNAVDDRYCESTSGQVHEAGITIRKLKKSFDTGLFNNKKVDALRGITMEFYKGQITSLLGHNGAGKSTLMSIITGIISPTNGEIFINSKNVKEKPSDVLKEFGLCAQNDIFFPSLTVTEQLEFFAMIKTKVKSKSEVTAEVANLLDKLKLCHVKNELPSALSRDQRRKLCLGMAFVGDPSILILDEPTSHLHFESKRVIWDLLMEMKGEKTILVSTHDMEEADLLGDRIAILHEGRLRCCGTSLFLKKIIAGQGNIEITLSIERWSHPESIRTALHPEAVIINSGDRKIVVSVPVASNFPDSLKFLETKQKELGISTYSLSLVSLEQVFHKLTHRKYNFDDPIRTVDHNRRQVDGIALFNRLARALLLKKLIYTIKEPLMLFVQIIMISIGLLAVMITSLSLDSVKTRHKGQVVDINLGMYRRPYTLYSSSNQTIGESYKAACQDQFGESIEITNSSLYKEMLRRAKENLLDYKDNFIAAAEFNQSNSGLVVNAFCSDRMSYSLPISINLVWNAVLKTLMDHSFSISLSQQIPKISFHYVPEIFAIRIGCYIAILLISLCFLSATFAVHPCRESSNSLKHLQKMTGVSAFTYWATMFIFDLIHFTFLILLSVIGFVWLDYSFGFEFNDTNNIITMILIFMLFAINALPLAYIFSCIKRKTNTIVKLVTFIPIATGFIEYAMLTLPLMDFKENFRKIYKVMHPFQRQIFLFLPHTNFVHVVMEFYATSSINSRCRRVWNHLYDRDYVLNEPSSINNSNNCHDGTYSSGKSFVLENIMFTSINFEESLAYLCLLPVLYFIILAAIEGRLIQKLMIKYKTRGIKKFIPDEQMQREKSFVLENIRAFAGNETSQTHLRRDTVVKSNSQAFLAYELRKYYGKVKAVEDVTFSVKHRECFGIYGANRAGKSAIFKMLTGEEIPDHGTVFIGDKHFQNDEQSFLSQIGYCPQQEPILQCLNSYDHLRLFARLRGVPEDQIEIEVQNWINKLNLGDWATLPSSTYSSGNKQRLNIAMALIGSPKLVLFDEPTIRVDPGMRRSFWDTIKSCQAAGQTFILASHNMDECEALCSRMVILVEGKSTCIGSPEELKQRFGAGYEVQIRFNPRTLGTQLDELKSSMRLLLPCTLTNEYSGSLMYYVSGPGTTWKRLYGILNKLKNKYEFIDDYIVIARLST